MGNQQGSNELSADRRKAVIGMLEDELPSIRKWAVADGATERAIDTFLRTVKQKLRSLQ